MDSKKIWVFGYGSLVWKPGFEYDRSLLGFVEGYDRRFWQGNATQRGTPDYLGRVATLVKSADGKTWGRAFELSCEKTIASLTYLDNREKELGGYTTIVTTFFSQDSKTAIPVMVYIATPSNEQYLGPAPLDQIADEVVTARGFSGHNVEYVLKLAEFFRERLPEMIDQHLFTIERHVRTRLKDKNIDVRTLMTSDDDELQNGVDGIVQDVERNKVGKSVAFTSTVPSRCLKCVSV